MLDPMIVTTKATGSIVLPVPRAIPKIQTQCHDDASSATVIVCQTTMIIINKLNKSTQMLPMVAG